MSASEQKPCIAIVCDTVPYPARSGDNKRISEMIQVLREQGWFVHLILTALVDRTALKVCHEHVDALHIYKGKGFRTRCRNLLRRSVRSFDRLTRHFGCPPAEDIASRILGRRIVLKVQDYWQRYPTGLDDFLADLYEKYPWKALIVEYIWLQHAIDKLPKSLVRFLDTHDIQYKRVEEFAFLGINFPLNITRDEEAQIFNRFDAVIAIQSDEASLIREMCPTLPVLTVGTSGLAPGQLPSNPVAGRILYVGGYNSVNIDGLKRFLIGCWTEILRLCPNAHLHVCGYIYRAFSNGNYQRVKFLGHIDDLETEYSEAELVVNPLWVGTGLKIKTVESLAHGKPLITTKKGVEGMDANVENACIISVDEQEFANSVVRLLSAAEARESLSRAAKAFAHSHLSIPFIYKDLLDFLGER